MREHRPPEPAERNHEERGMFDIAHRRALLDQDTQRIIRPSRDGDPDQLRIAGEFYSEPAVTTSDTAKQFRT